MNTDFFKLLGQTAYINNPELLEEFNNATEDKTEDKAS